MKTQPFRINGLTVNSQAIGEGVYRIICDKGDQAVVAFGMIPKWAIDMVEKHLRDKIIEEAAKQRECTVAEFAPFVCEKLVRETVNPILREISCAILGAAANAGKMIC